MNNYYLGKLIAANYKIATHPAAANERLTSQADRVLIIPTDFIPTEYRQEFKELVKLINENYGSRHPYKIIGIQNRTAAKYIKLLLDIQITLEFIRPSKDR